MQRYQAGIPHKKCVFCFLESEREGNKSDIDSRVLVVKDRAILRALWKLYPYTFRITENKSVLLQQVCKDRGWREYPDTSGKLDEPRPSSCWNLNWRNTVMRKSQIQYLKCWQITNHIPKASMFCNKDALARYHKRMKTTYSKLYDFCPETFNLPREYTKLLAEHSRRMSNIPKVNDKEPPAGAVTVSNSWLLPKGKKAPIWISKPVGKSQGKGIVVFDAPCEFTYDVQCVVQEYIARPYLINGYKWDLRLYVCVTNTCPLTIYAYKEGIARFATKKYDLNTLEDIFSHLTNTSVNKQSPTYVKNKDTIGLGSKWTLKRLRQYIKQKKVNDYFLWQRIWSILILTIIGDAKDISGLNSKNAFEFLGFDILVDDHLKPHLLEVNVSPGLGSDTVSSVDEEVKRPMLDEMFTLLGLPDIREFETGINDAECCPFHNSVFGDEDTVDKRHAFSTDTAVVRSKFRHSLRSDYRNRPSEIRQTIRPASRSSVYSEIHGYSAAGLRGSVFQEAVELEDSQAADENIFEDSHSNWNSSFNIQELRQVRRSSTQYVESLLERANDSLWSEKRSTLPIIFAPDNNNNDTGSKWKNAVLKYDRLKNAPSHENASSARVLQKQGKSKVLEVKEEAISIRIPILYGSREKARTSVPANGPGMTKVHPWESGAPTSSGKWVRLFPFNRVTTEASKFRYEDDTRRSILQVSEYLIKVKEIIKTVDGKLNRTLNYDQYDEAIQMAGLLTTELWHPPL